MRIIAAIGGALTMIAGIAAGVVASRHHPGYLTSSGPRDPFGGSSTISYRIGWSSTTYDVVRIGGWALLIFGAVIVAFALIRELRASR